MSDNRKKFHEAKYGKRSNRDEDSGDRFRARDQYKEKGLSEQKRDGTKGERERETRSIERLGEDDASSTRTAFSSNPFERVTSGFFDRKSLVVTR